MHTITGTSQYQTKATTTEISFESGVTMPVSLNGKDVYYKVTFSEKRQVPVGADVERERQDLEDSVNKEIDDQLQMIADSVRDANKKDTN